jgi:hypothetical protein
MSPPSIFTAIEFIPNVEDDNLSTVTEPLLRYDVLISDDDSSLPVVSKTNKKSTHFGLVVLGTLTGFLIQMVSLGAYAFMLTQYGEMEENSKNAALEIDWFVYGILSVLTQVDLVLYVLIWTAFTCTMTRNGMAFIRLQYQMPVKRRSIFVLGVYFLVGVVVGAFVAWTMIDVYLGFPIPFVPIIVTVVVDLALCYLMVFCYDLGGRKEISTDDEELTCCC